MLPLLLLLVADPVLDTSDAAPPDALAKPVRDALAGTALTVRDAPGGEAVLTLWRRGTLPAKAEPEQVANGLTYAEIPPGTLVGAVEFHKPWSDFRKQGVPAGVYTLRVAKQPETGEHDGTLPHPHVCLLTPAADDPDAGEVAPRDLYERSKRVIGADHPSPMLLWPEPKPPESPELGSPKAGVRAIRCRLAVESGGGVGRMGFAFVWEGAYRE